MVQVFSEKQQDDEYRNRYTGIGHVEYIPEEYRFAAGIGNEGEIEHINYFAIKEGGIAAPFGKEGSNLIGSTLVENDAVEYRIDDIAGSSGCEHGNSQYISLTGILAY